MEKVKESVRTCKELGADCVIAKDVKPARRRRLTMTAAEKLAESKKMRVGKEMFQASGQTMEGKVPGKKDEERITRQSAKAMVTDAIEDCVDAGTLAAGMKACIKKDGMSKFVLFVVVVGCVASIKCMLSSTILTKNQLFNHSRW